MLKLTFSLLQDIFQLKLMPVCLQIASACWKLQKCFHCLGTNQELMVAMTACKGKKKGLILAILTTKPNSKQL